jgi:hypothetical protein
MRNLVQAQGYRECDRPVLSADSARNRVFKGIARRVVTLKNPIVELTLF